MTGCLGLTTRATALYLPLLCDQRDAGRRACQRLHKRRASLWERRDLPFLPLSAIRESGYN
jgi:hypothetical protein